MTLPPRDAPRILRPSPAEDEYWMRRALDLAGRAATAGDVPVGAVLVDFLRVDGGAGAADSADGGAGCELGDSVGARDLAGEPAAISAGDSTHILGRLISTGFNARESLGDPTAHAEILALREAGTRAANWHFDTCTLYVTLEPCTMCAGAIVLSRLHRVVFGAWEPKTGAAGSVRDVLRDSRLNHQVRVRGGILADASSALLTSYFSTKR